MLFLLPGSRPLYEKVVDPMVTFLMSPFIPSPTLGKMCWSVNLQKCGTIFYCWFLMNRYSTQDHLTSWIYLSLHGTYGMMWCLKELIFPDPNWQKPVTVFQHLVGLAACLLPYWYMAWSVNYYRTDASFPRIAFCIWLHTVGNVLMMASDTQKFFVLKAKKGLIKDGWFAKCRNTNYLGEIMIYGSYACLSQDRLSWAILIYVWTLLFGRNMVNKEKSFERKRGGKDYIASSGMLFPKLY